MCFLASAKEVVWDNGGESSDWNDGKNWDSDVVPMATDSIEIPIGSVVIIPASYGAASGFVDNEGELTIDGSLSIDGVNSQGVFNKSV